MSLGHRGHKRSMKRLAAPKYIQIKRKHGKWFINPRPGPHPKKFCLPLGHIVRELLKYARTSKEARRIIKAKKVLVDGRGVADPKFPVGLMDVVSIPETSQHFRVIPDKKKGLVLFEIDEKEAQFKLCRIDNKTTVKGGHVQLNLHDGRNIVIEVADPKKPVEDSYKTRDSLKISIPDQEILEHLPFKLQNEILIVGGKNIGETGKMENVVKHYGPAASVVSIKNNEGILVDTALDYTFVVGKRSPSISLPN
ncbi:MAG: 30S ribosomal protein S4e [Promethearchaeota archaeon]